MLTPHSLRLGSAQRKLRRSCPPSQVSSLAPLPFQAENISGVILSASDQARANGPCRFRVCF